MNQPVLIIKMDSLPVHRHFIVMFYCRSADDCCEDLVIDASAANYLTVRCENYDRTCYNIQIIGSPSSYAYNIVET